MLRLGKLPAKRDERNLKLARILKPELPPVPPAWDVDLGLPKAAPVPVFANDEWGCCVISGRAHHTLAFESHEQGRVLQITDAEVLREYWREGGGDEHSRPDNGLVVLDSLKAWRQLGWNAGGQKHDIYAFAEIDRRQVKAVKAAIFLLNGGVGGGLLLPRSAKEQWEAGQCWHVTPGRGHARGSWGGHYAAFCGYSHIGPTVKTWGKKQLMSWAFFLNYCDELYGIVDNRDRFLQDSPVDVAKLDKYLRAVTA